ncbi:MAG: TniB family NTP-binding protein [Pseudoalteromonas sp.]|uniref:TniB family NTP-binding protein n=1 Tax=Pseudoalteromonas sp. TaxID=53249 RepID=UPI0025CDC145|nr:TniB family NTP-binding protein [Pseudoalteromonas sp.]MCH2089138.1 TniB family NTP-binding protein [Pseudoalteromonas sp.]
MLTDQQKERLNEFRNVFIEYPIITTVFNDFDRLRLGQGLAGEKPCMLLNGDTGTGKTALIKQYKERHLPQFINGVMNHPVLVSRIPSNPTLESTLAELLKDLGQLGSTERKLRINGTRLTTSLIKCLKTCGTELIIIDEFQELIEHNQGKKRREIANRLKYINDEAGVSIVLVGMPWAEKIADEPQWSSRLLVRRQLPYFKLSENPKHFVQLIIGLANRMPFTEKPNLSEQATVFALFSLSKGGFRTLKFFLDDAVLYALLDNAKTLTTKHLVKAFEVLFPDVPNLFTLPVAEITASEVERYSLYKPESAQDEDPFIATKFTDKMPISQLLRK